MVKEIRRNIYPTKGILLIGVSEALENFEDTRFIEGIRMDRKDRDEFRIGKDK